jgi:hypothetical protein
VQADDGVAAEADHQPTIEELTLVVRELDLLSPRTRGALGANVLRDRTSRRHVWTVHL